MKGKGNETVMAALVSVICLLVPIQMASQTWDDHDRSGRYVCRDFGQNYLNSMQAKGNPIIYTNGDNDTFPLWYNQETEGVRTDTRVCNLSYLQTDWYIDQMRRPAYDSPSVPIHWKRLEYVTGQNEYIQVRPEAKQQLLALYKQHPQEAAQQYGEDPFELKNILKYWVRSSNEELHFIPTDTVHITLDKEAILRSGMMLPNVSKDSLPDKMYIPMPKRTLYKNDLMMLEMLANTNWERPIYMAITVGQSNHMGLDPFFVQEGLAYRITPFDWRKYGYAQTYGRDYVVDSQKMYDNLMNKFRFGGIENPHVYLDENILRMCSTHRNLFAILVKQLLREGQKDKALKALAYCKKVIPASQVPYDYFRNGALDIAKAYLQLGQDKEGNRILKDLMDKSFEYIEWYMSQGGYSDDCMTHFYLMNEYMKVLDGEKNKPAFANGYAKKFDMLYTQFSKRFGV